MEAVFSMLRIVAWKVADRALVMADWNGFREACFQNVEPAGLLRWCARMLASLGLLDGWWFVPYVFVGVLLGSVAYRLFPCRRRGLPLFLLGGLFVPFYPLWTYGTGVWTDPEPASALMNALGLLVTALILLAGLRLCRRGVLSASAFSVCCCALFPFFGLYALLGGLWGVVSLLRQRRRFVAGVLLLSLAGTLPLAATCLYGRLALPIALDRAHAFRRRFAPPQPIGPILAMERRVRDGDWQGVLKVADARRAAGCAYPLRMEIAYRLLAQFHLGRLPDDLFRYPIRTCHLTNKADELYMDGHLLLFGYGLLLPARREIFERSAMSGLEPGQLRLLGDIALLRRETNQAFRYYAMLSRCPLRNAFASGRLHFMYGETTDGADDLRTLMPLAAFVENTPRTAENGFYAGGQNVEAYAYAVFRGLTSVPFNLARLVLAVGLLEGDESVVAGNLPLLSKLYPAPALWPAVIREALFLQAARLDGPERKKFAESIPDGAVTPADEARFNRFRAAAANAADPASLLSEFGDTYSFYRTFVTGGGR